LHAIEDIVIKIIDLALCVSSLKRTSAPKYGWCDQSKKDTVLKIIDLTMRGSNFVSREYCEKPARTKITSEHLLLSSSTVPLRNLKVMSFARVSY
jgi:hypothetical protein